MKIKLLLVALLTVTLNLQSNAAVTIDQTLSRDYVINNGYSSQIYESMKVVRSRALGEEYYTPGEKRAGFWKRLHGYIDPAMDDYSFYHHDIKETPTIKDL